jgi:hypothetical protein
MLQGTTHDTVRAEIGYGKKVSQRRWSKKVEEGTGLTARHRDAQRLEVPRVVGIGNIRNIREPQKPCMLDTLRGEPIPN